MTSEERSLMNRRRSLRSCLAATALVGPLALVSTACNQSADSAAVTASDADTVMVEHMDYTPDSVTVPVGATVSWTFDDGAILHDVVFDDVDIASEQMADGTFHHAFTEPGTYTYHCSLHPNMTGTIEVTS
jgi:plastocyanin